MFRRAVRQIVPCRSFDYDLVAASASGELAYTVGYEHVSFGPGPVQDTRCASPTSTDARTTSGKSSTATAISCVSGGLRMRARPAEPKRATDEALWGRIPRARTGGLATG